MPVPRIDTPDIEPTPLPSSALAHLAPAATPAPIVATNRAPDITSVSAQPIVQTPTFNSSPKTYDWGPSIGVQFPSVQASGGDFTGNVSGSAGAVNVGGEVGGAVWNSARNQWEVWNGNDIVPVSGTARADLSGVTGGASGNPNSSSSQQTVDNKNAGLNSNRSEGGKITPGMAAALSAAPFLLAGIPDFGGSPNRNFTPDERGVTTEPTPGGNALARGLASVFAKMTPAQTNASLEKIFHTPQFSPAH